MVYLAIFFPFDTSMPTFLLITASWICISSTVFNRKTNSGHSCLPHSVTGSLLIVFPLSKGNKLRHPKISMFQRNYFWEYWYYVRNWVSLMHCLLFIIYTYHRVGQNSKIVISFSVYLYYVKWGTWVTLISDCWFWKLLDLII